MELKNTLGNVLFALDSAKTILQLVLAAREEAKSLRGADLYGANLRGANLRGANLRGSKIDCFLSAHSSGYPYQGWAVLFQDGSRWIRMGCLWKTLEDWDAITIRKSHMFEFPDDGSEKSECRADLFNLLRSALLRMKLTANPPAEK